MGLLAGIYGSLFKRTSTFALCIGVGVIGFERAFDSAADYVWESRNQGKLWKDIKHKYDAPADEE